MIEFSERQVPADVRDRITDTVHRRMADPRTRGVRTPLAVAAGVVVLAVAGGAVALSVHDRHQTEPVPGTRPATVSPAPSAAAANPAEELDRCWKAVVAQGKQRNFPARSTWVSVYREASPSGNVTALRVNGKTFFCMTTTATVTVTDPNAAVKPVPGTGTRVMLVSDNGWILGVGTDPNSTMAMVSPGPGYAIGVPAVNGVLIIQTEPERGLESRARFVGNQRIQYDVPKKIPPVPAPAAMRTDRPLPAPDRTSDAGRRLGTCLDQSGWTRDYADQWQPGVSVADGQWFAELATSQGQFGICVHSEHAGRYGPYTFAALTPVAGSSKPQYLMVDHMTYATGRGFRQFAVGTLPAGARTATVTTKDGTTHPAAVHEGQWAAVLPAVDPNTQPAEVPSTVRSIKVENAAGTVVYDGPPVVATP